MIRQTILAQKNAVNELLYGCYGGGFDVLLQRSVSMGKSLYFCRVEYYN